MRNSNLPLHLFDQVLQISSEQITLALYSVQWLAWDDFILNPRRLRGSDFLMRWSQGVWSEERLIAAVEATGRFFALPYGPSGVAPSDDIHAYEAYFERLERAGLRDAKRPDLLIFSASSAQTSGRLFRR